MLRKFDKKVPLKLRPRVPQPFPPVPQLPFNPQDANLAYWNLMNHNIALMQNRGMYPTSSKEFLPTPPANPRNNPRDNWKNDWAEQDWAEEDPWSRPEETEERRNTVSSNRSTTRTRFYE